MRTKYKPWAKPYIESHREQSPIIGEYTFPNDFSIEIGSGKGKFLLDMANKFPDMFFVGVEKNVTCAGFAAKKLVENETNNAIIIYEDAMNVVQSIKDNSVDNIFLNFSDPWPKKRHHKRRLTSIGFLDEYYRILKPNGKIYMKTDNDELYSFTLENLENNKFKILQSSYNYDVLDEFDAETEYEMSFREKGMSIHRIVFTK